MTGNRRLPLGDTAPGENRRCCALTNNEATPFKSVSSVDTAGLRARYRALWRPDTDRTGPASAVLTLAREVPGLCDEVDRLAGLLAQARTAYADLAAAARAALSGLAEGESDPWWYLRDELGSGPVVPPDPGGCAGWCR
jgi:hypothetical protein